jgi:arylsulfatase I/J
VVDLWDTDKPAAGLNGTYSAFLYTDRSINVIDAHATAHPNNSRGLFMYIALQCTHSPEEAPQRFIDLYPAEWVPGRRVYNAMASAVDESVANITAALKRNDMWEHTLFVYSSDNGGPSLVGGASFANNYPFRGGKGNDFEGGTRVAAFVSGGYLPAAVRGTTLNGAIHIADWLATLCEIAGCNPEDAKAEAWNMDAQSSRLLPPVDSISAWPMLSGLNMTSARHIVPLCARGQDAAIIVGDLKLVAGPQGGTGYWWSPDYPNSTQKLNLTAPGCPAVDSEAGGCMYNISADPYESIDLAADPAYSAKRAELKAHMAAMIGSVFQSDDDGELDIASYAGAVREKWGGFSGPWLD